MYFDLYYPFKDKNGVIKPGVKPTRLEWSDIRKVMESEFVNETIDKIREGDKELKKSLPAICFTGVCSKTRAAKYMTPTQLVMIDIDHCQRAKEDWSEKIFPAMQEKDFVKDNLILAHITPSKGLRLVCVAQDGCSTLAENIEKISKMFTLGEFGDVDTAVKDFSRVSFICKYEDVLYESARLLMNTEQEFPKLLKNDFSESIEEVSESERSLLDKDDPSEIFSDKEIEEFENLDYRGTPVKVIIPKYVEEFGSPTAGEVHNYYNEMVKNFRTITSNNKRALLYLLPRFGHTYDECWSQIKSICKVNTLSSIPKQFYFFLKDNGYYQPRENAQGALKEYMMSEEEEKWEKPPYLPPVFRELVNTAPKDFVLPSISALLPILGTLTSYVQARYPYDDRMHTTSFFSVIYAPPGTGKGFVERFMDMLFVDLKIRDFVQSQRENVYLRIINKKGDNEKAPDMPHVSLRLIPPKNSEAEFLQKQSDNHGYHMFTYAAEMDSWAKGVKAAGGNKDDMIRVAWDNGEYGQQFKSANTFKGTVRLFWNVLITGTLPQVESYFKNVENGLVTRCTFMSIDNQEFVEAPKWKSISKKGLEVINRFVERCDENTYESPCTINPEDLAMVSDEDFDKEVDWRFKFKEKKTVDMNWIMPVIDNFHKRQMKLAAMDIDKARDVFRRRVGVRGFRLALLCTCLWENPKKSDLEKCKVFIEWWMEKELESMLKLWGAKYNEQADTTPKLVQRSVFTELPAVFSRTDVYTVCIKQGIKTPIRRILFDWKKLGYVIQEDKDTFKKR